MNDDNHGDNQMKYANILIMQIYENNAIVPNKTVVLIIMV